MTRHLCVLASLVLGLALGACGGSSDGGPLPVDYATLSRDNALEIAGAVLGSAIESSELGGYTSLLALSGSLTPFQQSPVITMAGGLQMADPAPVFKPVYPGMLQSPIAPTTSPCGVGGTVTLSGDISTTQTLTVGDTIAFEFEDCDDGVRVVSGSFAMTITSFAGDFVGGSFAFSVDATLGTFQVTQNSETNGPMDGVVSIDLDLTSTPSLGLTVESDSLTISDGTLAHTLESYLLARSSDSVTGAYTLLVSGRASNASLDGAVDFSTIEALQSADGGNPFTGRVEISGDRASMTIIVLDGTSLRLEVDETGNGTVDAVIDTTWDALT